MGDPKASRSLPPFTRGSPTTSVPFRRPIDQCVPPFRPVRRAPVGSRGCAVTAHVHAAVRRHSHSLMGLSFSATRFFQARTGASVAPRGRGPVNARPDPAGAVGNTQGFPALSDPAWGEAPVTPTARRSLGRPCAGAAVRFGFWSGAHQDSRQGCAPSRAVFSPSRHPLLPSHKLC
jgi:hypothetical protein